MAHVIHAIKKNDEEFVFRLWSTNGDEYVSNEMSDTEIREYLLKVAVCDAITEHNREIDERMTRAIKLGTSSMLGDTRSLDNWSESRG